MFMTYFSFDVITVFTAWVYFQEDPLEKKPRIILRLHFKWTIIFRKNCKEPKKVTKFSHKEKTQMVNFKEPEKGHLHNQI